MADLQFLDTHGLSTFKDLLLKYVDNADAESIKSVALSDDNAAILFYRIANPTEDTQPAYSIKIPNYESTGNAMVNLIPYFGISDNAKSYPSLEDENAWTLDMPEAKSGQYLWVAFLSEFADGSNEWIAPVLLTDTYTRTELDNRLKPVFGKKEDLESAKENGEIDNYDLLLLDNGEIGWVDKDNNIVISTPRTQDNFTLQDGTIVEAGKTMDEIVELIDTVQTMGANPFIEL